MNVFVVFCQRTDTTEEGDGDFQCIFDTEEKACHFCTEMTDALTPMEPYMYRYKQVSVE